ncbi:MAG: hypothetical protein JXR83_12520 [Deltaproteobacteria bacterium]|nr:hypothetical protein [Deltaproteobacteria bacterium]
MRRPGSWLRALTGTAALVAAMACGNPRLVVVVTIPEGTDRSRLTIALSIYESEAARTIDCGTIASGATALAELREHRIFSKVLLSPQDGVSDIRDGVAPVPCAGTKILHALGAFDAAAGTEIEPHRAALVGCEMVGEIDEDVQVIVATRVTGN